MVLLVVAVVEDLVVVDVVLLDYHILPFLSFEKNKQYLDHILLLQKDDWFYRCTHCLFVTF